MLESVVFSKELDFRTVLMDSWYATQKLMAHIDQLGKIYYCPLKCNRRSGSKFWFKAIARQLWVKVGWHPPDD